VSLNNYVVFCQIFSGIGIIVVNEALQSGFDVGLGYLIMVHNMTLFNGGCLYFIYFDTYAVIEFLSFIIMR